MDPRFVAVTSEALRHRSPTASVWIRGGGVIGTGARCLVIFSPGKPTLPHQVRLYPLDGPAKKEPIMSVGYAAPPKSHIIQEAEGVVVFITPTSRRRRVEYQLKLVDDNPSTGNMIEALIDLDHLIFFMALNGDIDAEAASPIYEKIGKLKALALSTDFGGERKAALEAALKLAKGLAKI